MSVGQLLTMHASLRAQTIERMNATMRMRLAHLAAHGAKKKADEAAAYADLARELTNIQKEASGE